METYIAVIDGTGPWNDAEYARVMAGSFCRQLARHMGRYAGYLRGPAAAGMEVRVEAVAAADWLRAAQRRSPGARLMLAGYSRGASAAIYAAELLAETKHQVAALFLFDAVARHIFFGGEVIPANVAFSRHAQRSQDFSFVARYEGTIGRFSNPTRPSFGNTGLRHAGAGDHARRIFLGSHGALGGVGWRVVREDASCQVQVAAWFNRVFRSQRLPVTLASSPPAG